MYLSFSMHLLLSLSLKYRCNEKLLRSVVMCGPHYLCMFIKIYGPAVGGAEENSGTVTRHTDGCVTQETQHRREALGSERSRSHRQESQGVRGRPRSSFLLGFTCEQGRWGVNVSF